MSNVANTGKRTDEAPEDCLGDEAQVSKQYPTEMFKFCGFFYQLIKNFCQVQIYIVRETSKTAKSH